MKENLQTATLAGDELSGSSPGYAKGLTVHPSSK